MCVRGMCGCVYALFCCCVTCVACMHACICVWVYVRMLSCEYVCMGTYMDMQVSRSVGVYMQIQLCTRVCGVVCVLVCVYMCI